MPRRKALGREIEGNYEDLSARNPNFVESHHFGKHRPVRLAKRNATFGDTDKHLGESRPEQGDPGQCPPALRKSHRYCYSLLIQPGL